MTYYVHEWIAGTRTASPSLDAAYAERDEKQANALARGFDLTQVRYGIDQRAD